MTYQQPWETGYAPKAAPPEPDSRISEIDPQNPFENTLENPEYRMDYRRTLPQILLPGYQIPLFPERDERKAIRKSFNTAGFWIFMSCVLEQVLFLVLMLVISCAWAYPRDNICSGLVTKRRRISRTLPCSLH